MNPRNALRRRIAHALAAHAVRVADPQQAEWARAMLHELEHLPPDESGLSWALGCVLVSYRSRLRALARLPGLPDEALLAICLVGLAVPCWNFLTIAVSTARGDAFWASAFQGSWQAGLLYGSATSIGPAGLAAVLWCVSSPQRRPGPTCMAALWIFTVWALATLYLPAPSPLLTHTDAPMRTILVNLVIFPALAVAMLQTLNARRRRVLG